MKILLALVFLSTSAMAQTKALTYEDFIKVNQTVFNNSLPEHLINLHRVVNSEDKRMIAGDFEKNRESRKKKTYLDGLRSKLEGSKGLSRF